MRLVDLDAKEPYLLDGRYAIGILDNAPTSERPKGDLISREALKKQFANECLHECYYCKLAKWDKKGAIYNCGLIDNAPTVEPFEPDYVGAERLKARQRGYEDGYHTGMEIGKTLNPKIKQGEWIKVKEERMSIDMSGEIVTRYKCSKCGRPITILPSKLAEYPFCHCGAEMRGKEE
jgi:DNA-directed RNA polymerase subunit RPC12/RpoP